MKLKDFLGRKAMIYLEYIKKTKTSLCRRKVCIVKAMVSPGITYGCESWAIEKTEHQITDAFELWCWKRFLRVPWTARKSNLSILGNQSWIFIGRTDDEAEAPILWPPDGKSWLTDGERRRGLQRVRWLYSITDSMGVNLRKLWEIVKDRGDWGAAGHGVTKSQTRLSDSTTIYVGLPRWCCGKESACQAGDTGDVSLIPGSVRSPGEGNGNPLQYSCLGNPMDRGSWWATVLGVSRSWIQLRA